MSTSISVKVLTLGEQATNCYIIWSSATGEGYIIDPADEGDIISQFVVAQAITPLGILLTHGHFDHLLALLELQLNFPVPAYLHPDDRFLLERANSTAQHFLGRMVDPIPKTTLALAEGQEFRLGRENLRVIHTPGHTPGSCCLYVEAKEAFNKHILFTGDTLFSYGIEPLTHRYSNPLALNESLHKLEALGAEVTILPGHGESATLSEALKQKDGSNF